MRQYQALILLVLSSLTLANDYLYILAQEWPGSLCRAKSCLIEHQNNYRGTTWSLHGLWSNINNKYSCEEINSCTAEPYRPQLISQNVISKLDRHWVGFFSSQDEFRSHEWAKHGTCWKGRSLFPSAYKQDSYFGTIVILKNLYNIYEGLSQAGIIPDDQILYNLVDIKEAIINYLQKVSKYDQVDEDMIEIQCQKDQVTNKQMLFQIFICLNDDYIPMNCNCDNDFIKDDKGSCTSSQLLYPKFIY